MKQLHSTGIKLSFHQGFTSHEAGLWSASVEFSTWDHGQPASIEGSVGPRYLGEMATVIDLAKDAAESIGVVFHDPQIYLPEEEDAEGLPPNSEERVREQCQRLGWHVRETQRERATG